MLTHIDEKNLPKMVDIQHKKITFRKASASASIHLNHKIMEFVKNDDINTKKGPVIQTAIIAGTMAVKKTADMIPFCHPIPLEKCNFSVSINLEKQKIDVEVTVAAHYKTGIEMEALHGVTTCCLTIYDMLKAIDHGMTISDIKVIEKEGGKNNFNEKIQ